MANLTVGDLTYEGWASAEPSGDHQITWHVTYRTLRLVYPSAPLRDQGDSPLL